MNPVGFSQLKSLFQITSFSFVGKRTTRVLSTAAYVVAPGPYRSFGDAVFAKN